MAYGKQRWSLHSSFYIGYRHAANNERRHSRSPFIGILIIFVDLVFSSLFNLSLVMIPPDQWLVLDQELIKLRLVYITRAASQQKQSHCQSNFTQCYPLELFKQIWIYVYLLVKHTNVYIRNHSNASSRDASFFQHRAFSCQGYIKSCYNNGSSRPIKVTQIIDRYINQYSCID